jgi:hypothetical protein
MMAWRQVTEVDVGPKGGMWAGYINNSGYYPGPGPTVKVSCLKPGFSWKPRVTTDGWAGNLVVPWSIISPLAPKVKAGSVWRLNFYRCAPALGLMGCLVRASLSHCRALRMDHAIDAEGDKNASAWAVTYCDRVPHAHQKATNHGPCNPEHVPKYFGVGILDAKKKLREGDEFSGSLKSDDDDGKLDCRWTVNEHQYDLYGKLSPAMRAGVSTQITTVYPGGQVMASGFIDYPTELFVVVPHHAAAHASITSTATAMGSSSSNGGGGSCATVQNDTAVFEGSSGHVAAATIDDCCRACATNPRCTFALYQHLNPLPSHHCWIMNASTMTPRAQRDTQLITVADRPAPPPPPAMYWRDAWQHNLATMPEHMVRWTQLQLNGSTKPGMLLVDYEPSWRPSWRFPNPNGTAQPKWAAFLATVHARAIDTNWTSLVGWTVPTTATNWASLTPLQQTDLQSLSWEYFAKQYLTAGLRAIKASLPRGVVLSFWNWPFKFGKDGKPFWWDEVMDGMGWLWSELPIFMPDLYPEFYSGSAASMPSVLSSPPGRCVALGANATASYYQANVDNALRLKAKWNPAAKVYLSVWWHYMCSQKVTQDIGFFVDDGNMAALFSRTRGHDGLALWGSLGTFTGEDRNVTEVKLYLDRVWGPHIAKHCLPVGGPVRGERQTLKTDDAVQPNCPAPFTIVSSLQGYSYNASSPRVDYIVCEDLTTANSTLIFVALTGSQANIVLRKRLVPQTLADEDSYLGFNKSYVMDASHDVLGQALLAKAGGFTLADVTAAIPPIRMMKGPWTWLATRESTVDVALGPGGDDMASMGLPTPAKLQFTPMFNETPIAHMTLRGRKIGVWDGLVGGYLPVVTFFYPDDSPTTEIAPGLLDAPGCTQGTDMADGDIPRKQHVPPGGNPGARPGFNSSKECRAACVENAECFAFVFAGCNDTCDGKCECFLKRSVEKFSNRSCRCTGFVRPAPPPSKPNTRYWEMQVAPVPQGGGHEVPVHIRYQRVEDGRVVAARFFNNFAQNCESTSINTSEPSSRFYANLLDQHHFWAQTFAEGAQLQLPRRNDTDGAMLVNQMRHARVRDMITRNDGVWPRYGETPGYGGYGNNGFQETFTASMMSALEYGQFSYARDVLENYLHYYCLPSGGVMYRGLEMAQSARMLTNFAQWYEYTRDFDPLIKYLPKIRAIAQLLLRRRDLALALPAADPAYGCLTGDDEADLYGTAIDPKYKTEMAFISITAEAWRGFRDLGRAMSAIGAARADTEISRLGRELSGNSTLLWATFRAAMSKNVLPGTPPCRPFVFGRRGQTCGELPPSSAPSQRDSESWRTYSEALYSGAILRSELEDILAWHKLKPTQRGSSLKAGALAGSGGALINGDQLMTFTGHGWAYGLLQHDLIEDFLLLFYTTSAHAYTRGSWVAPESTSVDRAQPSVTFATPAGLSQPIFLRWMLLVDDPIEERLWVGKAIPHEWFSAGETIVATGLPSRFGSVSFNFTTSAREIAVSLSFDARMLASWPAYGVKVRVRSRTRWTASQVTVDGRSWAATNASEQSILLSHPPPSDGAAMIVVSLDAGNR